MNKMTKFLLFGVYVLLPIFMIIWYFIPTGKDVLQFAEYRINKVCETYNLEPVQWKNVNDDSTEAEKELIEALDVNVNSLAVFDIPDSFNYILTDSEGQEYLVHFTHKTLWTGNTYFADEPVLIEK